MTRRLWIVLALLVVGIWAASWTVVRWRRQVLVSQLQGYEQQLDHPDPWIRLDAADGLLEIDAGRCEVMMVQAKALIEIGQWREARWVLTALERKSDASLRIQAFTLHLQSCFAEVEDSIARSSVGAADVTVDHVQGLLAEADGMIQSFQGSSQAKADISQFKLMHGYWQAALTRLILQDQVEQFAKLEAVASNDQVAAARAAVVDVRTRLGDLEDRVVNLSRQFIEQDPANPLGWRYLFQLLIDARAFDRARRVATEVAAIPELDMSLAGKLANTLLDLETLCAHWTTDQDIDIARQLLSHRQSIDMNQIDYRIAKIRLALHLKRYARARVLARGVLEDYPGHTGVMCLLGLAMVEQGQAQKAVELLSPMNERVRSAQVRYVLAAALLADDQIDRGREMLRQSLELQPRSLSAWVLFAQSMANAGFVLEAEQDIKAAENINPSHPLVLKLRMQLLLAQMDRAGIWRMLSEYQAAQRPFLRPQDVAMGAMMVLDDVRAVTRSVRQRLGQDPGDVFAILADSWRGASRESRLDLSAIAVRLLLEQLDMDPLEQPHVPLVPVLDRWRSDDPSKRPDPLTNACFVPSVHQLAAELVQLAIQRWPGEPMLLDLAMRLSLWTGDDPVAIEHLEHLARSGATLSDTAKLVRAHLAGDDLAVVASSNRIEPADRSRTTTPTDRLVTLATALRHEDDKAAQVLLEKMLDHLAWPEHALLLAIRNSLDRGQPEKAWAWLAVARRSHPSVAIMSRARLNLAMGQSRESLHELKRLLRAENTDSEVSRLAVDVFARACITLGQTQMAISMMETMAWSAHEQAPGIRMAVVDVLLDAGQTSAAVATLTAMLNETQIPLRWQDRVLARAQVVMPTDRVDRLLDRLLEGRPKDPLLLFYKAQNAIERGDLVGADGLLELALDSRPGAPRLLLAKARCVAIQGRLDQARKLYRQLMAQGGGISVVAQQEMDQLRQTFSTEGLR